MNKRNRHPQGVHDPEELASGASIDWIAKADGHSSTATTERHYRTWLLSDHRNITFSTAFSQEPAPKSTRQPREPARDAPESLYPSHRGAEI
jgi:hypothetical protein